MKSLRKVTLSVLAVLFVVVGSAFAGGQKEAATPSAGGPVTLSWFMWTGSQEEATAWKELAANVTKMYPNIQIKFDTDSWTGYWSKLQIEIASGTTQDIISLQSLRTIGYGSGFRSLDSYIANDPTIKIDQFDKTILDNLKYEGHQIALPYDYGPLVVFYNKNLFDKYHVPYPSVGWTFADFMNDLKALSQGNDYGYVFSSYVDFWVPFVLSNGGRYLDQNGKYKLTDPATIQAFQMMADAVKSHYAPPMVATGDTNWAQEQWLAGNVAMHDNGPWQIINFATTANFKMGIATVPAGPAGSITISAGSGFGVSKTTKYPEEAFKAVSVLTDAQSLKTLALAGRAFPARVPEQPFYFQAKGVDPNFRPILDFANAHTVPYTITTTWQQANDVLFKGLIPILNGQTPVAQGLAQLEQQLSSLQ